MEENEGKTSKALIVTAVIVIAAAIIAVVIVLATTLGGDKKSSDGGNANEEESYAKSNPPKNESSNGWEPRSLEYVPEETGDRIAKSIDDTIEMITDPYEINLFGVNDKQIYAVLLACMYSYENLDERAQSQVKNFDKLVSKYEELNKSLNSGSANVDSKTERYGRYSSYGEVNSFFSKESTVKKELYKEGEYFIDSYTVSLKRHIYRDPTIEWSANYSKTDDIYLYTFDVTFRRVNPDENEVASGPVHVYLKGGMVDPDQYAGDVVFDNCNVASGQFAITSTNSYNANDFDRLFTYDYGELEKVYIYDSSASVYNHQPDSGAEMYTIKDTYGDLYQDFSSYEGTLFDIKYIYPGQNVNFGPGFWPMVYVEGAQP